MKSNSESKDRVMNCPHLKEDIELIPAANHNEFIKG